jgi:nucleoside-diphosphate-sugar epimerase
VDRRGYAHQCADRGDNYGKTKFLAEQRIRQATAARGLSAVILNPVNVLGPHDRNNWTRQLILPISRGTLHVVPPGVAIWAYVTDVVDAHITAADKG